jgi:hypothetical protein
MYRPLGRSQIPPVRSGHVREPQGRSTDVPLAVVELLVQPPAVAGTSTARLDSCLWPPGSDPSKA